MEKIDATTDVLKVIENVKENEIPSSIIEKVAENEGIGIHHGEIFGGGTEGGTTISLDIKLGDIVLLCSPDNPLFDGHTFLVDYISDSRVSLIDVITLHEYTIGFNEKKQLIDKTIIGWKLQSREESNGYATLYGFLPKQWVNIHFHGDVPQIITGQITNLEEDMIEVLPWNKSDPIYIDFEYQGIPDYIGKIELREEPVLESQRKTQKIETGDIDDEIASNIEYLPSGESIITLSQTVEPVEPESIEYDEIAEEEFSLYVEIPENEKKYGIDIQTNELLEKFLEMIPLFKRTPRVLQNVHNLIERYKQLRKEIYTLDENGYPVSKKTKVYKPLVDAYQSLNAKLAWLIPVIKMQKKVYHSKDDAIIDDELPDDIQVIDYIENIVQQHNLHTNKNNARELETLYHEYTNEMTELQRPFVQSVKPVLHEMEAIVKEITTIETVPAKGKQEAETNLSTFPFYVQKLLPASSYFSGIDTVYGKKQYTFTEIEGDKVQVHSFYVLPETFIEYSRKDLPTTNILRRTELEMTPHYLFSLFQNKTVSADKTIPFFHPNKIVEYPVLADYLPDNNVLFSYASKTVDNRLSVANFIRAVEPFLIYYKNVNYETYQKIKELLILKIEQYISSFNKNKKLYKKLLPSSSSTEFKSTVIQHLIKGEDADTTAEFLELLNTVYSKEKGSSSELLYEITQKDAGVLLYTMVNYILYFLITPDKLIESGKHLPTLDNISDYEETIQPECRRRIIAKQYPSKKELEKDNGKTDVFFDSSLDETPYDIAKKYRKEKTKYTEKDFKEYLKTSLIDIHNCPPEQVDELVETMIQGKKQVKNGEYAVLVEIPLKGESKKKYTYYKREKNRWTIDPSINDENGSLLNKFCDSVASCKKSPTLGTCEEKAQIDNTYYASIGERKTQLREKIDFIKKTFVIKSVLEHSVLNSKYNLGEDVKTDKNVVVSPYVDIRQLILAEPDFTRKQQYIVRFYTKFCREADFQEDRHWGYCRETNTKLFPKSLYELAVAFGNRVYPLKLDELIFSIGEASTDGDAVIDKHTGYVLKRVDDSTEEGYDDAGFKITTHAVLEKDAVDIVLKEMNKLKEKTFTNETAEKVYKIFNHLKLKTGVKDENEEIESFVMKQSIRFLCNSSKLPTTCVFNETIFASQKEFDKREKELEKKKKDYVKQKYETYMNRNIISVVVAMFLVKIQTSIPGIRPRNTYPKCQYSYGGFPMTPDNDIQGITFLACLVQSSAREGVLMKNNKELWMSIVKDYKIDNFIKNIKEILDYLVVSSTHRDAYLHELYTRKKEHLLTETQTTYAEYYEQIKKWTLFLPPLVPFSIKIKSVENGFETELKKQITHGHKQQHDMLNIYKSKMKQLSYGIVEKISTLLKNSAKSLLHSSFVQTACCNENTIVSPILYFVEKDKEIKHYVALIDKYYHEFTDFSDSKGKLLFFDSAVDQNRMMNVGRSYTKELIYAAYIHYCNYDNPLPVDDDLKDICNKKPDDYNPSASLKEKINLLEQNRIIYNEDQQIQRLMKIVHRRNTVVIPEKQHVSVVNRFVEFLKNEPRLDETLKTLMLDIVESNCKKGNKKTIVALEEIDHPENEKLYQLIEYLSVEIEKKYNYIIKFVKNNGKTSSVVKENVFLTQIKNKGFFPNNYEKTIQFVKNSAKDMIYMFPNIIVNNTDPLTLSLYPHWNFSYEHKNRLTSNYNDFYGELNKFFDKTDDVLHTFLYEIKDSLSFYIELIRLLPLYSHIEWKGNHTCYYLFNQTAVEQLLKYIWFSVVEIYLKTSEENMFIQKPKKR